MPSNKRRGFRFRIFFPLVAIVFALLLGGIVMLLWNAILPPLTGIKHIGYWQSVGLLVLCRILFGSFGRGRPGGPGTQWRGRWKDKLMKMTPEEREKFREEWRRRCEKPHNH